MTGLIRNIIVYGLLTTVIVLLAFYIPKLGRLRTEIDYSDIDGFDARNAVKVDRSVGFDRLNRYDAVAYRLWTPDEDKKDVYVGWVAALPGDRVSVEGGKLMINGSPSEKGGTVYQPPMGPVTIPANRFWVVSSFHKHDSLAWGPIPGTALLGRMKVLP